MASTCKDIIITIANYNPQDTYVVTLKTKSSLLKDKNGILPTYQQTATGSQVIFKSLPNGTYSAGLKRICAAGGESPIVWKDVTAPSCKPPTDFIIDNITDTAAEVSFTAAAGTTYDLLLDDELHTENIQDNDPIIDLVPGSMYKAQLRPNCGEYKYGFPRTFYFITDPTNVPDFTVRVVKKNCNGSIFDGYTVRFTISGALNPGDIYRVRFEEYNGTVHTLIQYTVQMSDTLEIVIKAIANQLAGTHMIIATDYAAFDILSREQKAPNGVIVDCEDIDLQTGYIVDII